MISEKKYNICFINSCKEWGGGEKWHYEIALYMMQQGHRVFMITNKKSELFEKINKHAVKCFPTTIKNLSFLNIFKVLYIGHFLKKEKIDVVVTGLPADMKLCGISAKIAGVKKIIYRRGMPLPVKNDFINKFLFSKVLTDVVANSIDVKKKLLERNPFLIDDKKVHILYNGINLNDLCFKNNSSGSTHEKIILGNAARLVPPKGHKYLIDIAVLLKEKQVNFEIQIVGKGPLQPFLIQYAKEKNVTDYIKFLGFSDDIHPFLKQIDIFLLPSVYEGTSNILLEAMAHSKPIIAFDVSSMPEIIQHAKNGFLVEFGNVDEFADRIIQLTQNPNLRLSLGTNAKKLIHDKFDYQNMYIKLIKIIER